MNGRIGIEPLEERRLFAGLTFTPITCDAGPAPVRVETGDFNSDGKADLVLSNVGDRATYGVSFGLSIMLGNGDGTFQPSHFIYERDEQRPTSIRVADLNGDGKLDLVTGDAILIGDGAGNFSVTPNPLGPGFLSSNFAFDVAELTGDGVLDIVFTDTAGSLSLQRGRGDGTFAAKVPLPSGGDFGSAAVVGPAGPTAEQSAGGPAGGGVQPAAIGADGMNGNSEFVFEADINGDGLNDVVQFDAFSDRFVVHLAMKDPATGALVYKIKSDIFFTAQLPKEVVVVAIDKAYPELLDGPMTNRSANPVLPLGTTSGPAAPKGFLMFVNSSKGTFNVANFDDTGSLNAATVYPLGSFPKSLRLGDVNNDGFSDVLITEKYSDSLSLLLGNGDGTFQQRQALSIGHFPEDSLFVDLNGDGRQDIVATNTFDDTISVLLNGAPEVKPALTIGLTSSDLTVKPGDAVTLTATVGGAAAVGKTVSFLDGNTIIGSAVVSAEGLASLTATFTAGKHRVVAAIAADEQNGASTSPTLTQYALLDIVPAGPTLTVTGTPTTPIVAGVKLPAITVAAKDAGGTTQVSRKAKVSVSIQSGPAGAVLAGTKRAALKKGAVTFKNLAFRTAGAYTLTFTSSVTDLAAASTSTFTVVPAAPKSLVFSSAPVTTATATPFSLTLNLRDKFGNTLTTDNTSVVTLSLSGKAQDILSGTSLTDAAAAGVFAFDALMLSTPGKYKLFAKAAGVKNATRAITVTGQFAPLLATLRNTLAAATHASTALQ